MVNVELGNLLVIRNISFVTGLLVRFRINVHLYVELPVTALHDTLICLLSSIVSGSFDDLGPDILRWLSVDGCGVSVRLGRLTLKLDDELMDQGPVTTTLS